MLDNDITKTSGEVSCKKIKAVYPHVVVSGDIDKPVYSIQYYDIEKKTMVDCCGSYDLRLVRRWIEEDFEAMESDITELINRLQGDKEALIARQETLQKALADSNTEVNRLKKRLVIAESGEINGELKKFIESKEDEIKKLKADISARISLEKMARQSFTLLSAYFIPEIAKNEATQEFAKRLKEMFIACPDVNDYVANAYIDRLVKESVGEA